jgi:predicted DCC family thiol-disulfide oxidoreductase YuxK
MITVYYDGKCGLCSKEIRHYKKIAPEGLFLWHDITKSAEELHQHGIKLADGLMFLHAKDSDGAIHIGVDAFILIWSRLQRWRLLAKIVSLPIIRHMTNSLYTIFAHWRFNRLEHCQLAAQQKG